MEKLTAAVIGLGRMGAEPSERLKGKVPKGWLPISHIESIISNSKLQLEAVCDSDSARLEHISKIYNVKNKFDDYKKLIDETSPFFLTIATRTAIRFKIIKYACEHGVKIIYLEKPISNTIDQCDEIIKIANKFDVILGYGVNRRYHETYRKAKEIIRSGTIGELEQITIEHGHTNLYWSHPHSIDLILYFANSTEIKYIQGNCSFINNYVLDDENFIDNDPLVNNAFIELDNNIKAIISQTNGTNTRLSCSKGIITIYSDGKSLEIMELNETGYLNNPKTINVKIDKSSTENAFDDLISSINNRDNIPISSEEILTGMKILNGIFFSSLKGGVKIAPKNIPKRLTITGKNGNYYA